MQNGLDRLLATYCSPTLAGIKPASLVSCDRNLYIPICRSGSANTAVMLSQREKFTLRSSRLQRTLLLLVYSKPQLERRMADPQVQHVLRHFAYPVGQPLDVLLRNLKRRIAMSKDFPHEIGLFLGYPIEDVVGFIRYAGKGCKLSGLWKVYGDAEAASRLFDRLSRVCHAVTRRVDKGETLLEVFAA